MNLTVCMNMIALKGFEQFKFYKIPLKNNTDKAQFNSDSYLRDLFDIHDQNNFIYYIYNIRFHKIKDFSIITTIILFSAHIF